MKKIMVLLVTGLVLILVNWVGVILIQQGIPFTDKAPQKAHEAVSTIANNIPDTSIQIDQVPQSIQEIKETIAKGNPDDSARALTKLVPDGNALLKHYGELIQIAESTTDEMNQEVLQAAWGKRGFAVIPKGKDRTSAIIEWITLKSWDVKNPLDKQHLLDRFAADVQRLITSGKLPVIWGLKCVRISVFGGGVDPDPQVSLHTVVALYEGHVPNTDKAMRDELWNEFKLIGTVLPEDEMTQLYTFLKQHYPEKTFPTVPRELFHQNEMVNEGPGPISSKEYEEIVEGSLDKLHSRLRQEECRNERSSYVSGSLAGERIVYEYNRNIDDVTALVESLFSEGLMVKQIFTHIDIASLLSGASRNNTGSVVPAPMVVSVLKSAGRNLSALSLDSLLTVHKTVNKCLTVLSQKDVNLSRDLADLQATCVDVQERLRVETERRRASGEYVDFSEASKYQ